MSESPRPRTIVAVTGEHGRYAAVRARAASMAAGNGARVILYDLDAVSPFESPVPTNWSAGGVEDAFPDRLSPEDAERSGRAGLAEQLRSLRRLGVDAWAWLPRETGGDALAGYAAEQGAELILVPAELEHPGFLDRIQGKTLDTTEAAAQVPVVVVEDEGVAVADEGATAEAR